MFRQRIRQVASTVSMALANRAWLPDFVPKLPVCHGQQARWRVRPRGRWVRPRGHPVSFRGLDTARRCFRKSVAPGVQPTEAGTSFPKCSPIRASRTRMHSSNRTIISHCTAIATRSSPTSACKVAITVCFTHQNVRGNPSCRRLCERVTRHGYLTLPRRPPRFEVRTPQSD